MTTIQEDFHRLEQAQTYIARRLTAFFASEEFQHYGFVVNEFDIFTLFLVSAAWLRLNDSGEEGQQQALIQFHQAQLLTMVERIIAAQVNEVDDQKAETLQEMVQNIMESRLRDYFIILEKNKEHEASLFFSELTDSFLTNFLNYDDPQLLQLTVALVTEVFQETLTLLAQATLKP